jgi:hypothetical protein
MLSSNKKILVLLSFIFSVNTSYADNSAMDCLKTGWEGNNYVFQNICDYNVYVMYCTEGKKTTGKFCGDYTGSKGLKGSFYTHTFNLKAGKTQSKYKPSGIRYGACKGMTGFGRDFTDHEDGTYVCEEPKRLYD